ncbi:MAG TPA: hypothetical protein VK921_17905 [Anditalea sp.]|nr:hypothetical protein [Anditalea sp.]
MTNPLRVLAGSCCPDNPYSLPKQNLLRHQPKGLHPWLPRFGHYVAGKLMCTGPTLWRRSPNAFFTGQVVTSQMSLTPARFNVHLYL